MKRTLEKTLKEDLEKKFILVSGPRQVGKTTLATSLSTDVEYLNYDSLNDRKKILQGKWNRSKLIIFDELHKMKKWKQWLKGVFDTEKGLKVVVTGSAKLETFRKVGDSMAGRYFHYNLFPLDLKELKQNGLKDAQKNLEQLLRLSGFPEPFLSQKESFYKKWRKTHLDIIIKQDLIELESIKRLQDVAMLIELMTERVASPISYNSLKEDLSTDDKTVKRWMLILENSYILFKVPPFAKSIKYAIKKSPKYYFFDYPRVLDEGAKLENLVALSLLKEINFRNDTEGENYELHYLRNRQHKEVDFLITKDRKPVIMIEVKTGDDTPSPNFSYFEKELKKINPSLKKVQLVKDLKRSFSTRDSIFVEDLASWLERIDF